MASVTYLVQDGERVQLGVPGETAELFYDISGNTIIVAAPSGGTISLDVDTTAEVTIAASGMVVASGITITAGGLAVTAGGISVTAGGIISIEATGVGIGYGTGAGGAVTQANNRTTGVTINKLTGTITTDNASLAVEVDAVFTVTNSTVAIGDCVIVTIQSGTNGGNTIVHVVVVAAGSFQIAVSNNNAAGGTTETGVIKINFAVIKAVSA